MVGATAGCVWGWPGPRRVDVPAAGQAGGLAKAGAAARRRAWATIQACPVVASAIKGTMAAVRRLPALLLLAAVLSACGGGSSTGPDAATARSTTVAEQS